MIYQSHPDVYNELLASFPKNNSLPGSKDYNDILWEINQTAIRKQTEKGVKFEYTLNGITKSDAEKDAIKAIWANASDDQIISKLKDPTIAKLPGRMKELIELYNAGYIPTFDSSSNSFILTKP